MELWLQPIAILILSVFEHETAASSFCLLSVLRAIVIAFLPIVNGWVVRVGLDNVISHWVGNIAKLAIVPLSIFSPVHWECQIREQVIIWNIRMRVSLGIEVGIWLSNVWKIGCPHLSAFVPVLCLLNSAVSVYKSAIGRPNLIECVVILGLKAAGNFWIQAQSFSLRFTIVSTVWKFDQTGVETWILNQFQVVSKVILGAASRIGNPLLGHGRRDKQRNVLHFLIFYFIKW